ncbi:beta-1,3-galactosyltransferase 1 [Caerostris darwini]|uniref:Hexosyltransferase n=1 Tax=Caerostris darwini TaxID=1538125 RepID=A0AAV4TY63_9ARAC|nr:beta-1,3-galactosyltransferase 1 [Caerostris darwini]
MVIELYIVKNSVQIVHFYHYKKQSTTNRLILAIRHKILEIKQSLGISEKLYNNLHNANSQENLSEHEEYHKFLSESRKNANKTFFFFNSTETFHKLFVTWLDSRSNTDVPFQINFTINHNNVCEEQGQQLSILIAVTSSATHLESRAAIRETWGGFAKDKGAKIVFFLGLPKNPKYKTRIWDENTKFQDIIQATFLDTYSNLTLKTISVLKWVSEVCSLVKYVLKVDDDMFINVENFLTLTEMKNHSSLIMGELAHEWHPVRSAKNKWFTSFVEYPFNVYPDFVFGPSYLLTGDTISLLYNESIKMKLFHLEDVYITGFVAEKVNIKRINLPAMFNTPRDLQPCNFKNLLSSHGHTPPDMRRHWMWLTRRNFKCES